MDFDLAAIKWIAVVVAAVATFFLGGIWYTALGPLWVKASRYTPEQVAAMKKLRPPAVFFGGMLVSYVIMAVVLAMLMTAIAPMSLTRGMCLGGVLWAGVAVPIGITSWIAGDKTLGVPAIDLAYQFVFLVMTGAILGGWR